MEFIETPAFTKNLFTYLDDEEYRLFQEFLTDHPEAGTVISGTGGLRKVRWGDPRRGKGKRGGIRIIYYYLHEASHIWLLTLYDKSEADDLTSAQKRRYQQLVENIRTAWIAVKRARP